MGSRALWRGAPEVLLILGGATGVLSDPLDSPLLPPSDRIGSVGPGRLSRTGSSPEVHGKSYVNSVYASQK